MMMQHPRKLTLTTLGVALALLQGTPAHALNSKSYVSNTGSDANNCSSVANACATFNVAMEQTAAGGEVTVVNTGDYFFAEIGKSINITNDGAGEASGSGIQINAGAGGIVGLRGLVVDGQGGLAADFGISIESASAVHIQNCVIRNFENGTNAFGLLANPSGNVKLFVSDTIIYNNGNVPFSGGIAITPLGSGTAEVVLDRVHAENNVIGILVGGIFGTGNGAHVVIRDSVVSGNIGDGIVAVSSPGQAPAFILVEHTSSVSNKGIGIHADGPRATILLKDNTITRNGTGISATNSGQLISYGNNTNNNNIGPEGAPNGFFSQM